MQIRTQKPGCSISQGFLAAVAFLAAPALSLEAAEPKAHDRNWPAWRGPAANGLVLHGNPPLEWSETKNIRWKVRVPGKGHATPIIWDNRIFLLTAVPAAQKTAWVKPSANVFAQAQPPQPPGGPRQGRGPGGRGGPRGPGGDGRPPEEQAFTILCLDRATGKVLWEKAARKDLPHSRFQPSNSYSSGSPVTDGQHVYSYFGAPGLYCHDVEGNLVWSKDLGKFDVTFGEGSSPTLHEDTLLVVQDTNGESFLYAFDKKTGNELWKTPRAEGSGWTTPYVLTHGGKTQAIVSGAKAVRSYDIKTGEILWQCSGLGANPVPMVVTDEDTLYAMSGHRNPARIAVKLGGSGDLTGTDSVRWVTADATNPYVPSPLLYDGLLFFCKRTEAVVTCIDPKSGTPHYSEERLEGVEGVYASPIGAKDRIYVVGRNGVTAVLAKSKELKVLARNTLNDPIDASPAVVGNELFLRGHEHLYCIAEN